MKYIPTIGLEIHVELKTRSKMFCSCANDSLEKHPNVNVCPICMGHPGTLPVINEEAVKKVLKVGLTLHSEIPEYSRFDRKNYFYPDLPKGYQISQYDKPLCIGGFLNIQIHNDSRKLLKSQTKNYKSQTNSKLQIQNSKLVRIRRIHLEEDTGKLLHPEGVDYSLVDFNRAGVPLMELVTEPDIHSAQEARVFTQELQLILRYLGVSDADMEKGQLRVEANISLINRESYSRIFGNKLKIDSRELGTKVEIKNLNSFRSVEKAIEYEIARQASILDKGEKVIQETRGWNDTKQITFSQRTKEEAHDYRYFPEPDLPPLFLRDKSRKNRGESLPIEDEAGLSPEYHFNIEELRAEISELPQERRERFLAEYKLSPAEIEIFVVQKDLGEYYEKVMSELRAWVKEVEQKGAVPEQEFEKLAKLASNYIQSDLQGLLKGASVTGEDFLITPEDFAELITLIYENKISSKIAKQVLVEMFATGADPHHIVEEKKLVQISDEKELEKIANEVIAQNKKAVEDYKKGKQAVLQFLVGQVMAKTRGRAEPGRVLEVLKRNLEGTVQATEHN